MALMRKHTCPYCKGEGFVSKKKAGKVVIARDRTKHNLAMREVNRRARARAKEKALAT
jgi:DnaJ-class molecular chaperone